LQRHPTSDVVDSISPFGGCSRLLEHYRQIGSALIVYERTMYASLFSTFGDSREFSPSVAFVPVEVLESYLDDLLDLGVADESLFIKRVRPSSRALATSCVWLAALCLGFFSVVTIVSAIPIPALLLGSFLAGLGSASYFLPRTRILRRFGFATIISREIASRRGHDKSALGGFATTLLMREFWRGREGGQTSRLPPHPARIAVRYYH